MMKIRHGIVTLIMAAAAAICMSGCNIGNFYSNANKYTSGDREITDEISQIDINWTSGSVSVSRYDKDTVSITETCSDKLEDSKKVHTWVDGKKLRVQYSKSGESFWFKSYDKKLEIKIPKDMKLDDLDFDGSSSDINLDELEAEHIRIDVSSGDVKVTDCSAKTIDADSSSGNVTIEQKGESDSISADSSSGKVRITAEKVGKISVDTSSGRAAVDVKEAKTVKIDTSSGDSELSVDKIPSNVSIDTSSGDVKIYVPEDSEFEAEVDTSSGDVDSEFAMSEKNDTYTKGSGGNKMSIDTSSGDVSFRLVDDD